MTQQATDKVNGLPVIGFGTFGRTGEDGIATIAAALETGYRHLDTAQGYGNEAENGEGLRRSGVARDEVFVTTKIQRDNFDAGKLIPSLKESLDKLKLDRVDLTLIHWPATDGLDMGVYLDQLAEAKAEGLTSHIGVSNFTVDLLDQAEGILGKGEIATNQVEVHPYLQNRRVADHCARLGIAVTCYQPIAKGTVSDDVVLKAIGEKHGASPAQVTLAYLMALGHVVIPTTSKTERVRENFGALDITLDDGDRDEIAALDRGQRRVNPDSAPDWD